MSRIKSLNLLLLNKARCRPVSIITSPNLMLYSSLTLSLLTRFKLAHDVRNLSAICSGILSHLRTWLSQRMCRFVINFWLQCRQVVSCWRLSFQLDMNMSLNPSISAFFNRALVSCDGESCSIKSLIVDSPPCEELDVSPLDGTIIVLQWHLLIKRLIYSFLRSRWSIASFRRAMTWCEARALRAHLSPYASLCTC